MSSTTPTAASGIDLDPAALDKLEALARAATPGPWEATHQTDDECNFAGYFIEAVGKTISDDGTAPDSKDALFIAAANPATVLQLIALARRATQQAGVPQTFSQFGNSEHTAAGTGDADERALTDAVVRLMRREGAAPSSADVRAAGSKDATRLDKFIDWYLRGGKRSEIHPWGHVKRTTREHIMAWLDASPATDGEKGEA